MKKAIALLLLLTLSALAMASCRKNPTPPSEGSSESGEDLNMDPNGWTDN